MGNAQSLGVDWTLVGRHREVEKSKNMITGKINCFQINGLKKIGKSRIMSEVYRNITSDSTKWTCLWKDFQYESNLNTETEWIRIFSMAFDRLLNNKAAFSDSLSGGSFQCNKCENCLDSLNKCLKWTRCLENVIDLLINNLKVTEQRIILFLDNVDKLMDTNPDVKDCFLKFLKCSRSKQFKIVVSSTKKVSLGGPDIGTMEVEPLNHEDTLKLLYVTTDGMDLEYSECVPDIENMFCEENEVFILDNKVCLELIAQLCDGLPLAAIMSGALLTEYEGMFSPVELLEILTQVRMKTLSPDNCPPDDRLDIYKSEMQQVKELDEQFTSFFENLSEKSQDKFSLKDALAASGKKDITSASLKNDVLKKLLDRCVISVKKMSKEHQWRWHGILREANTAMTVFGKVSSEPDASAAVMKFTKENAKLIGLELVDDVLSDAKAFEHAIRRLAKLSTEDDTEIESGVIERLEATEVTTHPPHYLLADNAQNNLSLSDNDNQRVDLPDKDIIYSHPYDHMNIRVPVEHCMEADIVGGVGNDPEKVDERYRKLDNIIVTSDDMRHDFEHQETSRTPLNKTIKTMESSQCSCSVGIQGDQANKLAGYNNALHNDTLCRETVLGFEDLPPPYTSVDTNESRHVNKTVSDLKQGMCNCNEETFRNTQRCNTRENMTLTAKGDTELVNRQMHSSNTHNVNPTNNILTTQALECGHSLTGQHIGEYENHSHRVTSNGMADRHEPSTNGNESDHHLGNCTVHDKSISDHNCSYTGPPGLIYEPPPTALCNVGVGDSHLCVLSIDPSVNKCSVCEVRTKPCANSRDLTFSSSHPYNSQCGPSAMMWNSLSHGEQNSQLTANGATRSERNCTQTSQVMDDLQLLQ